MNGRPGVPAARRAACGKEIERARVEIGYARERLDKALSPWRDAILAAADADLEQAANLAGDAIAAAKALQTWEQHIRTWRSPVFGSVEPGRQHRGIDSLELPPDASAALTAWRQAYRRELHS